MKIKKSKLISTTIICLSILFLVTGIFAYFYFKNKENEWNFSNHNTSYKINEDKAFICDIWNLIDNKVITNKNNVGNSNYSYIRSKVSDHSPIGMRLNIENQVYNVGHWNTLNFTFNQTKQEKVDNISKTILFYKFDLIGLTEINANTVTENNKENATYFVNYINDLVPKNERKNIEYDIIVSNNTKSEMANENQSEQVAILYNKNKFKPIEYTNLNIKNDALVGNGYFYSNPLVDFNKETSRKYDYVRSPFGTMFNLVNSNVDYPITFLFSHFDSPGVSNSTNTKKTEVLIDGIGSQEYFEAYNLKSVLNEFEQKFNNKNIIFMGDTNIKTNKQKYAFNENELKVNNYNFLFKDSLEYATSLATVKTVEKYPDNKLKWYSNPYDKIIYSLQN